MQESLTLDKEISWAPVTVVAGFWERLVFPVSLSFLLSSRHFLFLFSYRNSFPIIQAM